MDHVDGAEPSTDADREPTVTPFDDGWTGTMVPLAVGMCGRRMMVRMKPRSADSILRGDGHFFERSFECSSSDTTPTPDW